MCKNINAERSFVDLISQILAELPIAKNQSIMSLRSITGDYPSASLGSRGL